MGQRAGADYRVARDSRALAAHGEVLDARARKRDRTLSRASELGLSGPIDGDHEQYPRTAAEREFQRLTYESKRLALLAEARSNGRLDAALDYFEMYKKEYPGCVNFKPIQGGPQDVVNIRNNKTIIEGFRQFMRKVTPVGRTKGFGLASDTLDGYASAVYILRSLEAGYCIFGTGADMITERAAKQRRLEDGPRGERAASLGLRAQDMRVAFPHWDWAKPNAGVYWALLAFGHNTVSRGIDIGVRSNGARPDPMVDLMWSHISWPNAMGDNHHMVAGMVPSKDVRARLKRCPIPIAKRPKLAGGSPDPMCAYHWVRRLWTQRQHLVPVEERPYTLFFTRDDGTPITPDDVVKAGREAARLAGWSADEIAKLGAKMLRVGGATDYRLDLGVEEGKAILKRRGRWASDIHEIYSRSSLTEQLDASARVGSTGGTDMERAFPGWVQPTTFR
jgi:hypothetical protein